MTATVQVHVSKSDGTPQQISADLEGEVREFVQRLQAKGFDVGGGQTRLPDGRTIDALNIAKGGPSTTAEPASSPARAGAMEQAPADQSQPPSETGTTQAPSTSSPSTTSQGQPPRSQKR